MNNNWKTAKLSEVCTLNPRKPKWDKADLQREVSFVPMAAVDAEAGAIVAPEVRSLSAVNKGYTYFGENDVLIAKITPCMENGKAAIAKKLLNGIGFGTTEFHVLRPSDDVVSEWVYHYIRQESFRRLAEHNMTGSVGQKRVPADFIAETKIPLPSLEEQRRIAAKLDILLAKVNKCKSRLERIPENLKRFRQSVLADACSGKLTEDWREENGAEEWQYGSLEEFCEIISGNAFKSGAFVNSGVPVIKIANVQYGAFEDDINQQYLPLNYAKEYSRFIVCENDILLALTRPITNDTLKVCQYPIGRERALLNQRVAMLRPKGTMSREFLLLYMQCRAFKEEIKTNLSETLQPNLSPKDLAKIEIACPSAEEQSVIVRQVGVFWAQAAKAEGRYSLAWPSVERLSQSILSKAFRGELLNGAAE